MKILHTVEFYPPSVGGVQEVVRQLSEGLARRGHDVTVATTHLPERDFDHLNGVHIKSFDITGNAVNGMHGAVGDYHDFLRHSQFDIMMNYAAQQWTVDLTLPLLDELPYRKVLIPCGFSGLYWPQYQNYFAQMPDFLNRYDHLIFHAGSYRDIDFARQHGISHFSVIPNGASEAEFSGSDPTFRARYSIPEDQPLILSVGSHTGTKGHQRTIEAFFHAPIKSGILLINGNTPSQGGCYKRCQVRKNIANFIMPPGKRVLLLDMPREDVVAAFQAADLFLFLSNIEYSPLVIFEAMAARTPFISLACGNVKEIVEWTGGGIIAPTQHSADGFVDGKSRKIGAHVAALLKDPQQLAEFAENGHTAWRKRFTWEKLIVEYEKVYEAVLAGSIDQHQGGQTSLSL